MWPMLIVSLSFAAAPRPAIYALDAGAPVWDVAAEDLDGSGKRALLLLTCDQKGEPIKKRIAVFAPDAAGVYAAKATSTLDLDASVGTLFFAETDGRPPRELVAANAAGATVYTYRKGAFEEAASPRYHSLFPSGSKEPMFFDDTAMDLDGDGIDEWLIPVASGYTLRHADAEITTVQCDVVSEIQRRGSIYITHRLPACHPFQLPGETVKGLAFLSDEYADFAAGPDWKTHRRFKVPVLLEDKWEAASRMDDVNEDGFPDLMVTQTKGTVNLEVSTQVYVASAPYTYPEEPTASFSSKGAISAPALADVDGDGKQDVVVISVPFGIKNLMNLFLRDKLTADVQVYLYNGKDFGDKPQYKTSLSLEAPEGREQVAYTLGDFNGDGRLDVAFGESGSKLAIHLGESARFLASDAWVTLEVPTFGRAVAKDLDGNAAKDIVLYHPSLDNSSKVEVVVF